MMRGYPCVVALTELLLLAGLSSTSGEAVTQSLQFVISILTHAQKSPQALATPLTQIGQLGGMSAELTAWLRRLVLGSSAEGSSEIRNNMVRLRKMVDLLVVPEW